MYHHQTITPYKSKSGKESGVTGYNIGDKYITVEFHGKEYYTYSQKVNKKSVVDHMKKLARASQGLSTFISRKQPHYELG